MPDVDAFRAALRREADALPIAALLPQVRVQARALGRRRRTVRATLVVVLLAAFSGVGWVALGQSGRDAPSGGAKPDLRPADLVGPTWRLVSWTTAEGATVRPTTDRPPTLVFDSQTTAHSDDPVNTTSWTVRLGKGTVSGDEGTTTLVAEPPSAWAANQALTAVLSGRASWQITGDQLVLRQADARRSVTYSRARVASPPSASAIGGLTDPVWYLTSWTVAGATGRPVTDQTPTLAFHDAQHAVTVIPTWVDWSVKVGNGSLQATRGEFDATPMSAATVAVFDALNSVLPGSTTWQVTGRLLVIRRGADSLTFTSDLTAELPGRVEITLTAAHGAGLTVQGKGSVGGEVRLTRKDGRGYSSSTVGPGVTSVSVEPGAYDVTATIKDGACTPTSVFVQSDVPVALTVSCRDRLATD